MKNKKKYIISTILLFCIEVTIALFVHDSIIRPYLGDYLAVILLYCFIRSITLLKTKQVLLVVLVISVGIEFCQYFDLLKRVGLHHSLIAESIVGTTFDWKDIAIYLVGLASIALVEKYRKNL